MSISDDPKCDECGNVKIQVEGEWVCPICDDVTLFTEDEKSGQDEVDDGA